MNHLNATCSSMELELRPDRSLLNSDFETYRLSLDKLPGYEKTLSREVCVNKIQSSMFSREHAKLFYSTNHLFCDRWNPDIIVFIGADWSVYCIRDVDEMQGVQEPVLVYDDVKLWGEMQSKDHEDSNIYQPTITFPSPEHALMTDGMGTVKLFYTNRRQDQTTWKLLLCNGRSPSYVIYDSCLLRPSESDKERLIAYVKGRVTEDPKTSRHYTEVSVDIISYDHDGNISCPENSSVVLPCVNVDYVSIDETGDCYIASNAFEFDKPYTVGLDRSNVIFTWQQEEEELSIAIGIGSDVSKDDIAVEFSVQSLTVSVKGESVLAGQLERSILPSESTWCVILEDSKLEITLMKREPGLWKEVIPGERRGEYIDDPGAAQEIQSQIRHMHTTNYNESVDREELINQPRQMDWEQIDYKIDNQTIYLCQFGYYSKKPKSVVNLSSGLNWLFELPAVEGHTKGFCVSHDVDGIVYKPTGVASEPYKHVTTFNALQYVQASKEKRRFTSCSPDYSYASISDTVKHVYIYRQPTPVESDFRNRKTGAKIKSTAIQQIIELPGGDSVLGLATLNRSLYILTKRHIHKYKV